MKIAEREMVMEIGMMMMKMEMATHCAQECQFLIKRIDIKYTPSGTCKNCCTLATTVCGRTFNAALVQKYSYFFSYPNL